MLKHIKPSCIIKHDTGTNDARINNRVKQTMESIMNKMDSKNLNDKGEVENGRKCNDSKRNPRRKEERN
jgi:hypothetical protein